MQQFKLCATAAAMLCIAPIAVSYAQSNNELFSPSTSNIAFDDGKDVNTGSFAGFGYEVISGHAIVEGDMVLGQVDGRGYLLASAARGLGQSRLLDRWENGIIPYQYGAEISEQERSLAEQAVAHWNTRTAISLVEITDGTGGDTGSDYENYIQFEASNGCASYVGMRGGEQQLWISASCGVGSIIHEIGHAVGLFHEHTRADRDNFINVQWDNIVPGKEFNFDVLNANVTQLGEYDYGSIMHYGERFFSRTGDNTINVLDGVSEIGQRIALSERDIQSVNEMYATDLALNVIADDSSEADEFSADINVSNQGELGANGLELTLRLANGGAWTATSTNPGWQCSANGALLNCTRDTLSASVTSVFTVAADVSGAANRSMSVELNSNTFDNDLSNNGFNATVTQAPVNTVSAETTVAANDTDNGAVTEPAVVAEPAVAETNQQTVATNAPAAEQGGVAETIAEQAQPVVVTPIIVEQPAQQSAQPVIAAAVPEVSAEPGAPAAALPGIESATSALTESSSSGGAFSPLGGIVLFLLTFVARTRRAPNHG